VKEKYEILYICEQTNGVSMGVGGWRWFSKKTTANQSSVWQGRRQSNKEGKRNNWVKSSFIRESVVGAPTKPFLLSMQSSRGEV